MAAPTFVAEYETAWTGNPSSLSKSVTTAVGDQLVIIAGESNGGGTLGTPTDDGPGLTYTLRQSIHVSSSWADAYVWTATATSAATFNITVAKTGGSPVWGFNVLRFSGSSGIGASSKTNVSGGAPSLGITTTGANSAIVVINTDWNAVDGASRTWRTAGSAATEVTYVKASTFVTDYGAYHADAGSAGAKTVGLSAPSGQKYSIIAVEILAGGATTYSASGTVAAVSGTTGAVTALLGAAGATAATTATTGAVTARLQAAGSTPAVSGTTGAITAKLAATGSVAAVSSTSGAVTSLRQVAGTVAATSGTTGAVTVTSPGSLAAAGTVAVVSGTTGAVTSLRQAAGTAAAVSGTSGTITVLRQAAGTVAATSGTSGTVTALRQAFGTIAATSGTGGSSTALLRVAGTTEVVSDTGGSITALLLAAGNVAAVSGTSGSAHLFMPEVNITIIAGPITCGWDAAIPLKGWSAGQPSGDQWAGTPPTKGWTADQPNGDQWTGDKPTSAPWTGDKPVKGWTPGPVTN